MSSRRIEDGRLVRGEDDTLNELDENAIEAAVSLVEEVGGEVIAVTMGPDDAEDSAMLALQKGADRAIVISDERLAGSDVIGTAHVLAAAARALAHDDAGSEEPIDLILTGMASLDGMTSMLPAALAAALEWPVLGLAHSLSVTDGRVRIEKSADGFDDTLAVELPAVVSVTDQVNEPRYPNFKDMKAARSKPLDVWSLDDLAEYLGDAPVGTDGAAVQIVSAEAQPERERGTVIPDSGNAADVLVDYLREVIQ